MKSLTLKFAHTVLLSVALASAGALCVGGAQEVRGQQQQQRQIVVPLPGTGYVAFKTAAAPTQATTATAAADASFVGASGIGAMLKPQMLIGENNLVHRVLVDTEGHFVFGYDLTVEPMLATKQFKIFVKPLSAELEKQLRARDAARLAPAEQNQQARISKTLPRVAEAQIIGDGDELALDLLVNQQSGVKIVDLVKVSAAPFRSPDVAFAYPPPRDFTLNNVELALRDFKLRINDEEVAAKNVARECKGALVWFYVPGRGRFIFSLAPHAGYDFRKIGVIEDNKISFALEGTTYEWISRASVINANSSGKWNLWVLHDKDYTPELYAPEARASETKSIETVLHNAMSSKQSALKTTETTSNTRAANQSPNAARVSVGSADRIENLLPRR